jgi:hypothetical protein
MFSKCKNPMDVLAVLNNMADNVPSVPKKQGMGDKYALVGVNARGAEFLTFLDRPIVHKLPKGYDKLIIYKEMEVLK